MDYCEYCNARFIKGDFVDIGVGFMQVSADSPSCDCLEDKGDEYCPNCNTINVVEEDGIWICTTCGEEYDIEEEDM